MGANLTRLYNLDTQSQSLALLYVQRRQIAVPIGPHSAARVDDLLGGDERVAGRHGLRGRVAPVAHPQQRGERDRQRVDVVPRAVAHEREQRDAQVDDRPPRVRPKRREEAEPVVPVVAPAVEAERAPLRLGHLPRPHPRQHRGEEEEEFHRHEYGEDAVARAVAGRLATGIEGVVVHALEEVDKDRPRRDAVEHATAGRFPRNAIEVCPVRRRSVLHRGDLTRERWASRHVKRQPATPAPPEGQPQNHGHEHGVERQRPHGVVPRGPVVANHVDRKGHELQGGEPLAPKLGAAKHRAPHNVLGRVVVLHEAQAEVARAAILKHGRVELAPVALRKDRVVRRLREALELRPLVVVGHRERQREYGVVVVGHARRATAAAHEERVRAHRVLLLEHKVKVDDLALALDHEVVDVQLHPARVLLVRHLGRFVVVFGVATAVFAIILGHVPRHYHHCRP